MLTVDLKLIQKSNKSQENKSGISFVRQVTIFPETLLSNKQSHA